MRVGCLAFAALLVTALLPGLAALLVGASTSAATAAGTMDVPTDVLGAIESDAASSAIPWAILAAIASVATDFGRHAPDGRLRGLTEGTIFPAVSPPISGNSAGVGMFLLDPASAPVDPQDVAQEAAALADMIATGAAARPWPAPVDPAGASLSVGAIADFWLKVVTALPLLIPHPAEATTPGDSIPASSGSTGAVNANPIQQFARDLLAALGDPATPQAVGAIAAWAAGEGSCARDNPLDTTQPEPGASPFNTLPGGGHVWNYPSWSEGVEATVATLRNGLYPTVLAALADQPTPVSLEAAVRNSPWGTGRFGPSTYRGAHCPPSAPAPPPGEAAANGSGIPGLIVARATSYQAAATPSGGAGLGGAPTKVASDDIPDQWLGVIREQADRFAVPWTLVAAVLKETCDFARSAAPGCQWPGSSAVGAGQGYALLAAAVWQRGLTPDSPIPRDGPAAPSGGGFATDGDGDGRADPWSVADAAASCARRLAGLGATQSGRAAQAVFAYRHGTAVPVDPADRLTAQTMSWFAAYGGDGTASAGSVLPVDRSWFEQHRDWFQRPHHDYPAVDIPVPAGTPVYAVTEATVIAADEGGGDTDCGHDVRLRDATGAVYTYCHGSAVLVSVGQHVVAGQLILRSGWSGHVLPAGPGGAHLHFQINLPGRSSSSCPQPALSAWADGRTIDLQGLPTQGCVSGSGT